MTAQDEIKIEADKDRDAITRAITEAVTKLFIKNIENNSGAPEQKVSEPDEEIPIYEKLSPGEIFIISRSDKGILVATNDDGECDIRYYNDNEE
uniref:Uncharacterized protein n=1 Tax=viral metagenome TaxID=1070528 RepID=A0A6H1ZI13_9ZZZZ